MKSLRRVLAFAVSFSLLLSGVSARPSPAQCDVLNRYSSVLDTVFPANWSQCRGSRYLFFGEPQLTIRRLPSFFRESQVFICQVEPSQFFVVSSTLDPKDKPIWGHMLKSRKIDERTSESVPTTESAEKIAGVIHVIHRSCKLDPGIVDGWFRELATVNMSLPLSGGGNDGTTYELTLEHGMDRMQARIWIESGQQKPLIALVDNIYEQIERSNCTEIQRIPKKA